MNKTRYLLQGTLRVAARGYWYSAGGAKGAFGFYPHLKTPEGLPVYPDTQLHGDLRMAAHWALKLGALKSMAVIDTLFGKEGNEAAALLHLGDLTLSTSDRKKWKDQFFQVKPRIEINDETRTVQDKMLANFEAAWLDGIILEAPLYAGYFSSPEAMAQGRTLLEEAACLLSGFGAMRSRGYGRGELSIVWKEPEEVRTAEAEPPAERLVCRLESLVHLRSKPVAAGKRQLVASHTHITAEQMRGWFIRAWHETTGEWPTADEMAALSFTDLCPAPDRKALAYPSPMTTLRQGEEIEDWWGRPKDQGDEDSTLLGGKKAKKKPLASGCFVTEDKQVHEVAFAARMRNAIQDDFRTLDDGLFVQQYLSAGTLFTGRIILPDKASPFARKAYGILSNLKPVINGALFQSALAPEPGGSAATGPGLVVMPRPFRPGKGAEKDVVNLGVKRRYATALRRPRRALPVILPGSVVTAPDDRFGVAAWPGFGRKLELLKKPPQENPPPSEEKTCSEPLADRKIDWKGITRSQAGILRQLMNPGHPKDAVLKYLRDIRDKHEKKDDKSALFKLYDVLTKICEKQGMEPLQKTLEGILDHLKAEIWWEKKLKKKQGKGGMP